MISWEDDPTYTGRNKYYISVLFSTRESPDLGIFKAPGLKVATGFDLILDPSPDNNKLQGVHSLARLSRSVWGTDEPPC